MGDQDGLWGLTGQGKRLRLAAWGLSRGDAHLAARPGLSLRGGTVGGAVAWSHPHESGKKDEETREERLPRKALKREFHRATPPSPKPKSQTPSSADPGTPSRGVAGHRGIGLDDRLTACSFIEHLLCASSAATKRGSVPTQPSTKRRQIMSITTHRET